MIGNSVVPIRHHESFSFDTCNQIVEFCKQHFVADLTPADVDKVIAAYHNWLQAKGFTIVDTWPKDKSCN